MALKVMSGKMEPLDLSVNLASSDAEGNPAAADDDPDSSADPLQQPEAIFIKLERLDNEEDDPPSPRSPLAPDVQLTVKQEPLYTSPDISMEFTDQELLHIPRERPAYYSEEVLSAKQLPNGKYPCPLCPLEVATRNSLHRHMSLHTRPPAPCKLCPLSFPDLPSLHDHVSTSHSDTTLYQCDLCEKFFKTQGNLYQHKRVHLTIKPYQCEVCLKSFKIKSNFDRHKGKNSCKEPVGNLECTICNKTFRRQYLYKSHMKMHEVERPFECHCGMAFKFKSTLVRHMQLHKDFKPFPCKVCGKKFTSRGLIKPHMRMHTGEKPYTCPICQKTFSHKHNMQRHSLRHDRIKNLVCEVCHKQFPKESRLKYHMRSHMEDNRPFKCDLCPKKFSHRQNIVRHYKKKHPNNVYDRPETDATFANVIWEKVLSKKMADQKDYILPEMDCDLEFSVDVKLEKDTAPSESPSIEPSIE